MSSFRDDLKKAFESIEQIKVMLTGNGHPEEGLIYKNQKNTEFRNFWEKIGWVVIVAVIGILVKSFF